VIATSAGIRPRNRFQRRDTADLQAHPRDIADLPTIATSVRPERCEGACHDVPLGQISVRIPRKPTHDSHPATSGRAGKPGRDQVNTVAATGADVVG
jgi:hypothetical protein